VPHYLQDLTLLLGEGLGRLPDEVRARHGEYFRQAQQADGGFGGREGGSDLYYSGFALRGLALCGLLEGETATRAAAYLQSRLAAQLPMVDFLSLIYSAALLDMAAGIDIFAAQPPTWKTNVAAALEQFRRADGGYAKTDEGDASSTYHTFLVVICYQILDLPVPNPERIVQFVLDRQRIEGGFVEIGPMKRGGTNPTAAAIALLKILGGLTAQLRESTIEFIAEMQNDEGGLRANTRIPIADLLSTFTGLLTLFDLQAPDAVRLKPLRHFVKSLEQPTGGFFAAAWDTTADVEYTFYGLAALALLAR